MASVNKVILIGNLTSDPEVRYTPSWGAVCNFSIATSESWKDKGGEEKEATTFHRIVVWGKLAEICAQYLAKGRQVYIEGSILNREYLKEGVKKYISEIKAREVVFLGDRQDATKQRQSGYDGAHDKDQGNHGFGASTPPADEDVPF